MNDPALFDRLEQDLLKVLQGGVSNNRYGAEYLAWAAQGLAYSGNEKYRGSIAKLKGKNFHKKVRRHAESSLAALPKFAVWNSKISVGLAGLPATELLRKRTFNMLTSEEPELMRGGASLVSKHFMDEVEMLALVEKLLLENYTQVNGHADMADALAWMCKVLGLSGNAKYRDTLQTVRQNSQDRAVVRWAEKSLLKL